MLVQGLWPDSPRCRSGPLYRPTNRAGCSPSGPLAPPGVRGAMILTYRRRMRRALFLLAPRWLALHVLVVAAGVTMVLLGRWQWHVAHVHHGAVQNYA